MKAISVRQPWAWLIVMGWKPVENRTWYTKHRGPTLIHAAKGMTVREYIDACNFLSEIRQDILIPNIDALQYGGIVGVVDIVDCVSESDSPWFVGPQGFVLADPMQLPFQPLKGRLGFFEVQA